MDAACAQHRPKRHLDRAGVGRRHNADAMVIGHLKDLAGQVDGLFEFSLADLGAVGTAERRIAQRIRRPARALGAGTR